MTASHEDTAQLLRAAAARQRTSSQVDLDEVVRRGARRRGRRAGATAVALSAGATAVVVAAATVGTALLSSPYRVGPAASQTAAAEQLALLGRPATEDDRMPAVGGLGAADLGMVPESTRLVVSADGRSYYAGTGPEGDVCIAVHLVAVEVSGSSCTTPDDFSARGVWVATTGPSGVGASALLLPDRVDVDDPDELGRFADGAGVQVEEVLAPNVVAVTQPVAPAP